MEARSETMTRKEAEAKGWIVTPKNGVGGSATKGTVKLGAWRMELLYKMIAEIEAGKEVMQSSIIYKQGEQPRKKVWA